MAFRQMTVDSEAGPYQMWVDDATGQTTTTNPALAGAGLGYVNEMRQGPDGEMVDTQLVSTIGGIPADQFITRPRPDGRLETYNPSTGQWEKTYRAPFDMAGGNQFVPESIGKPIGGAFIEFNKPAENEGSLFERALPMLIMGGLTSGIGSAIGAGTGLGSIASGALAGGGTAAITGNNPVTGALMGGALGGAKDYFGGGNLTTGGPDAGAGFMGEDLFDLVGQQGAAGSGANMDFNSLFNEMVPQYGSTDTSYLTNNFGDGMQYPDTTPNAQGSWQQQLLNSGIPLPDSLKGALSTANAGLTGASALSKLLSGESGSTGGSELSKLLGLTGTSGSILDMLGRAVPGLLGAYAANKQTDAMTDLANKFGEYGAPSRARYEASMTPGFDPTSIPGYSGALDTASQSILRKLSATGGNPYGNPGGLIEANKQIVAGTALPAIQQYQNQNANTGGLGALAAAYPSTQAAATQSGANVYNALGNAAGEVFNPKQTPAQSLADIYKLINSGMKAA